MVHILVTGANGQIGRHAARYLREAGHVVYGLVRDEKQSADLLKVDVIPVVGDMSRIESFAETISKVSAIIDPVMVYAQDPFAANKALLAAVAAESKKQGHKKRYIYISGGWVYGDYPGQVVDESFPCLNPALGYRVNFEKAVCANAEVQGVVIRPSAVYGGDWGMWRHLWAPTDKAVITGHKDRIFGWNHVADVSDALLRVVEAATGLVSGEVFDVAEDTRIAYWDLRRKIWHVAGYKVKEEEGPVDQKNFVDFASNIRCVQAGQKIRRVLGWKPRHSIVDELPGAFHQLTALGLLQKPK